MACRRRHTWHDAFGIEPRKLVEASESLVAALEIACRLVSVTAHSCAGEREAGAALEDILDSKRAPNQPQDQMASPYLEPLRKSQPLTFWVR